MVASDEVDDVVARPWFWTTGVVERKEEFEALVLCRGKGVGNLVCVIRPALGDVERKGVNVSVLGQINLGFLLAHAKAYCVAHYEVGKHSLCLRMTGR